MCTYALKGAPLSTTTSVACAPLCSISWLATSPETARSHVIVVGIVCFWILHLVPMRWYNSNSAEQAEEPSWRHPTSTNKSSCGRSAGASSISIVLNIAQPSEFSKGDKRRYYLAARGSATQSAAILDVCFPT